MIFFSVVIPTYNRAHLIETTIRSALAQNYPSFEVIVIDDGSSDNTAEVVSSIKDERLKYIRIKNSERGYARNYGASVAKGDYVNFFDSDDLLYVTHLSEASRLAEALHRPEVFHLGYDVKDEHGRLKKTVNNFKGDITLKLLLEGNLLSCNGVFLRRDIIAKHPFNEDRILAGSEDYELWLRLASVYPIHYSNTVTSTIIDHQQRSVVQINKEKLVARLLALIEYLEKDKDFMKRFGKYVGFLEANAYSYIALHLALTGHFKKDALHYLRKAVARHPGIIFSKRFVAIHKHLVIQ